MIDTWECWFAWRPIYVDAYSYDDTRNGELRYRVWLRWVERAWRPESYDNDTDHSTPAHWNYRLPQRLKQRRPYFPCPYCPNPDRNKFSGCRWHEDKTVSDGSDPPCVCDAYGTARG